MLNQIQSLKKNKKMHKKNSKKYNDNTQLNEAKLI